MKYIVLVLLLIAAIPEAQAENCINRTLEISCCIDEQAANQVIAREFAKTDFDNTFEGDIGPIHYVFRLEAPSIDFELNTATLIADLIIKVGPLEVTLDFTPSVTLNYTTSLGEIQGVLNSVPTVIDNLDLSSLGLDYFTELTLKAALKSAYEDLNITVYPQKILDEVNALIPGEYKITVEDITVSLQAKQDVLDVRFGIDVEACEPEFSGCAFSRQENGSWRVFATITTNVEAVVDRVMIWDLGGRELISYTTPTSVYPSANPNLINLAPDIYANGSYYVRIRLRTPNNIYTIQEKCWF